jgi:D-amino-acid dehydrogenase
LQDAVLKGQKFDLIEFMKPISGKYANPTTLRQEIQDNLRHIRASFKVPAVQLLRSTPFAVAHSVPPTTAIGRSGAIGSARLASLGIRYHRQHIHSLESQTMRILVLGSGVVGVTSAYYLARQGHEVTVVDRQPAAGMETSFANAGQVSPGYSAPWAAPGIPIKAMKWLMMKHRPLVLWPRIELRLWGWLAHMLANCTEEAYRRNKSRMVSLAEYSRDCLRELRQETGITYDHREQGLLQLFRTQKQLDGIGEDIAVLDAYGVPYEILDPAGCVGVEPALGLVKSKVAGGLRLLGDETGDAHLFTQRLAAIAEQLGVRFRYSTSVQKILTEGERISGVQANGGEVLTADAYVAAMGSYTPQLVKPLGIHLPVYPVKGYSLTMPITDADAVPASTVMDETYKVGITRCVSSPI